VTHKLKPGRRESWTHKNRELEDTYLRKVHPTLKKPLVVSGAGKVEGLLLDRRRRRVKKRRRSEARARDRETF